MAPSSPLTGTPPRPAAVKGEPIDRWYCGKAHQHGGNLQAVMRPDGLPVWVSGVEPGSVHALNAARVHALGALYAAASRGLPTLADGGYLGAGHGVHVPVRHPPAARSCTPTTAP